MLEDMWRRLSYPADSLVKKVFTNPTFGGFRTFNTFKDRISCFVEQVAGRRPEDIDGSGEQGPEASRVIHAAIESLKQVCLAKLRQW